MKIIFYFTLFNIIVKILKCMTLVVEYTPKSSIFGQLFLQ